VLGEEVGDLGVQAGDAVVEVVDVASELADAARGGSLREAVAEFDALELAQLALALAANGPGLGDRIMLCPVSTQPLYRLVRSRTKRRRCSSSLPSARTSSGSSAARAGTGRSR
jgi:hypothetical protein